jgi:uncharacterized protein DUF6959
MKSILVRCYSSGANNVILQLPDRKFPGILIQGDTFRNILEMARTVRTLVRSGDKDLQDEADGLVSTLEDIYLWYERAVSNGEAEGGTSK